MNFKLYKLSSSQDLVVGLVIFKNGPNVVQSQKRQEKSLQSVVATSSSFFGNILREQNLKRINHEETLPLSSTGPGPFQDHFDS